MVAMILDGLMNSFIQNGAAATVERNSNLIFRSLFSSADLLDVSQEDIV